MEARLGGWLGGGKEAEKRFRPERSRRKHRAGVGRVGLGARGPTCLQPKRTLGARGETSQWDRLSGSLGRSWSVGQVGQDAIAGRGAVAGSRVGGQCNADAAPELRTA